MRMAPVTRIHGVNSRISRDWSWTCELLVMELAHRVSTGIFFAGGLRSALGRTSCSGPRTHLGRGSTLIRMVIGNISFGRWMAIIGERERMAMY